MKKKSFFLLIAVFAAALLVWVGCTTLQATDGEEPSISDITTKWEGSSHADMTSEAFNHWNEDDPAEVPTYCAKCHSSSGFRDFIGADGSAAGSVEMAGKIQDPINCTACHSTAAHELDSVTFPSGTEVTGTGSASVCMSCHGGMGSGKAVADATSGKPEDEPIGDQGIMGNHYFAAAAVRAGSDGGNGFEYEGKTYVGTFTHAPGVETCTTCHDPHSLHTRKPENADTNLCQTCHSNVTGWQEYKTVSMSKADYDGDGSVESMYDEIEGMKALLHQAMSQYSAKVGDGTMFGFNGNAYPYSFIDTNKDGQISEDEAAFPNQYKLFTPRLLKAAYNYMFTVKEPGAYIHNGKYVLQLMYDSIEDLSAVSGVTTNGLIRP
jgi:hypothetical protein